MSSSYTSIAASNGYRLPHGIDTASRPVRASHEIVESATEVLEQCNSDVYLFITAPGVTSSELSSNAPHLRRAISHKGVQGKYTVSEAVELTVSTSNDLAQVAERKCGATKVDKSTMIEALTQKQDGKPIIVSWSYESLAGSMEGRDADVANAGMSGWVVACVILIWTGTDAHFYNNFVKDLPVDMKYTVIYSTTPANVVVSDEVAYEPTFDIGVHMDLKRALLTRAEPGPRSNDTRPLFEKYQFLTPGPFPCTAP
jgi:hypothetical protein